MTRLARPAGVVLVLAAFSAILAEWADYVSQVSRLSHVLLVPGLAAVLAWVAHTQRSGELHTVRRRWVGSLALATAGVLLCVGSLSGIFTLAVAGFPVAVTGLVLRHGGTAALYRYRYALLLLLAMVPPPLPLLDGITPYLVQASGDTTVFLLRLVEPEDVAWAGSELDFRGWTLLVAEACSGSGTLLVLGTLSLFLAGLFSMGPAALGITLVLVAPLSLLVNGLRIATSALLLDAFGPPAATGMAHEVLGQAVIILAGVLLAWGVARLTARAERRAGNRKEGAA